MPTEGTSVELSAGPPPVLTKRATTPGAVARLRSEAAILAAARHPGVVSLVGVDEQRDEEGRVVVMALTQRVAGSRTLANLGAVPPSRAAGLVAALAATVADLHRLGIAHGRITADHVVVAADGRPVLCGFAAGRACDARRGEDDGAAGADDVAALGALLRDLAQATDQVMEAPPTCHLSWRRSADTGLRAALLNLADHAASDEPSRRPTAAQFADAIRTAVPDASLADPVTEGATTSPPVDPPRPRHRAVLAGTAVVVALVALAVALTGDDGDPDRAMVAAGAPAPAVGPPAPSPTTTPEPNPATVRSSGADPDASTLSEQTVDAATLAGASGCVTDDGDGSTVIGQPCPVSLRYRSGALAVGDLTFDIGVSAAAAAIGDFSCTGQVVPAVLDLATGDVYVFDAWATLDGPVQAVATTRVPRARQLVAEPVGPRCHRLVVLDEWGIRHPVPPASEMSP